MAHEATDCAEQEHETGWNDRIVPVLEQVAGGTRRAKADGNRAGRHQDAAGRHVHPRKGRARRSGLSPCRHTAVRQLRPRAQGLRLRFAVEGEGPAHDRAAVAQRVRHEIRGGHLVSAASAATPVPTNSNWCCCRSTAASRTRAAWVPRRPASGRSGWAPIRSSKRRSNSVRVIDPDREPMFLANRPAIAVPALAPAQSALTRAGSGRRIRHLVVLEGGREE